MRHTKWTTVAVLSISLAAVLAAVSAPSAAVAAAKVPALASLSVIVGAGSTGQGTVIVTGTLPKSVALPAKMVVPVPAGLKPSWVGEIVGTDPAKDPSAKYTTKAGTKYDTVTIDLRSSRTAQVEFSSALPFAGGGTLYSADLPVLSSIGLATLSLGVPSGSKVESVSAGVTLRQSSGGTDLYSVTKTKPRIGKTLSASLIVPGAPGAGTAPASSAAGSVGVSISQIIALAAAALAGFGLVTFAGYMRDRHVIDN